MPETPTEPGPVPESQESGQRGDSSSQRPRPRWLKFLTPLVLLGLGLLASAFALIFYPFAATDLPTPLYSRLAIKSTFPLALIGLAVIQVSPTVAELKFSIELPSNTAAPPAGAPPAGLVVALPLGTAFRNCPAPFCKTLPGVAPASFWGVLLAFSPVGTTGRATADFFVKASSFGVAYNGVNASAAIPEVIYGGPGKPMLLVSYHIRSAASYDWSSFPTAAVSNFAAIWQEDLATGDTPGRAAIGINPGGQASHDLKIFLAGALIGLAGGAIISGVQEILRAVGA